MLARALALLSLGLVPTIAAADAPKPRSLSAAEVTAQLAPVSAEIEHCYLDRTPELRGAGKLALVLTVSRRGELEALVIETPGVPARVAKQIDGCIRKLVEPVSFPARKTFTTATVPYFFQRTLAANAGPQLSCWSASGCPGQ